MLQSQLTVQPALVPVVESEHVAESLAFLVEEVQPQIYLDRLCHLYGLYYRLIEVGSFLEIDNFSVSLNSE